MGGPRDWWYVVSCVFASLLLVVSCFSLVLFASSVFFCQVLRSSSPIFSLLLALSFSLSLSLSLAFQFNLVFRLFLVMRLWVCGTTFVVPFVIAKLIYSETYLEAGFWQIQAIMY